MPQFYLATDSNGYRHLLTVGTEATKMDPDAKSIEIGSDKTSIQTAMQELLTEADNARLAALVEVNTSDIPEASEEFFQKAKLVEPTKSDRRDVFEATDIEDFILNRALPTQVANIMQCLGTRFGEFISEKAGE